MKFIPISKPFISKEEIKAVEKVLRSGFLVAGERVRRFEKEFAKYLGVKYAVATSNGTTALHTALWVLGIGKGDEVITTPFSFIASSNCILYVGAKPVFVDIDDRTFNINPDLIEEKITERTKALLIVHLFGQPCDMKPIMKICKKHKLLLIEDCAQAHGAEYKGKKVGTFGDVACFSFYATKNLVTGEGGMIVTNKKKTAELARMIVDQGQRKKYDHAVLGHNFRMTEVEAAIGLIQLKKLEKLNEKRRRNAEFLNERLEEVEEIKTPYVLPSCKHVYHQYVIKARKRNKLQEYLLKKRIGTAVHYPKPIYKQEAYRKLGFNLRLPKVEKVVKEVLSLPVHPLLKRDDLERIVKEVKRFYL